MSDVLKLFSPVLNPIIIQPFGVNTTGIPNFYTRYKLPAHEGVDFRALLGTPIMACAPGIISRIELFPGPVKTNPYGIHVRIEHAIAADLYITVYAHFQRIAAGLKKGVAVTQGQVIGFADSTGNSRGNHLHLTLKWRGATANGFRQKLPDGRIVVYPSDVIDPTPFFAFDTK